MIKLLKLPALVLTIGVVLSACVATIPTFDDISMAQIGETPNHEKILNQHVQDHYIDPDSVNLRHVRDPIKTHYFAGAPKGEIMGQYDVAYIVCYEANGKNAYGGYTGFKRKFIAIKNDRVVASGQDTSHGVFCNNLRQ